MALANTGGDRQVLAQVLEAFREQVPVRLAAMEGAAAAGDGAALESAAHSLKGSASILGMAPLARLGLELETLGREGRTGEAAEPLSRLRAALERVFGEIPGDGSQG